MPPDRARDRLAGLEGPPPESVVVAGRTLRRGSRVRISPRAGGDVIDLTLAGRAARVEGIDQDQHGQAFLALVLDDDPGRDLGQGRFPGHRYFFSLEEIEPLEKADAAAARRLLVAGIGNTFLGDDGFGVEVARELSAHRLPAGVEVIELGIRRTDLVHALQDLRDGAILITALASPEPPGTLTALSVGAAAGAASRASVLDTRGMSSAHVLAAVASQSRIPDPMLVLACVPDPAQAAADPAAPLTELSGPVRDAVGRAADRVAALAARFQAEGGFGDPAWAGTREKGTHA